MTIIKVSYGKTFNLGSYSSERIDMECEITEDESPVMALSSLKDIVEGFHRENNKGLYIERTDYVPDNHVGNIPQEPEPQSIIPQTQEQKIKQLISQATSIPELKQWELLSKNKQYPDLKEIYDNKLNELTK